MTASTIHRDVPAVAATTQDLGTALRRLARAAARYAEAKRDAWTDQIKGMAEPSGATDRAVIAGLHAWVTGGNPATAALHAAWTGADGRTRAAVVATLLLLAVLAPVVLLLLLLALLVTALVLKARARTASR